MGIGVNMLRGTETRDPHVRALQSCIKRIIGQIPQIDKRSVQEGMAGTLIEDTTQLPARTDRNLFTQFGMKDCIRSPYTPVDPSDCPGSRPLIGSAGLQMKRDAAESGSEASKNSRIKQHLYLTIDLPTGSQLLS
jgi:hypothetical protein